MNTEILKTLNDGGSYHYAAVSGGLVLLDKNGIQAAVQGTLSDFLQLKSEGKIDVADTMGQGHHILHGKVWIYRAKPTQVKKFVIIEDYTHISIWDTMLYRNIPTLPTIPQGWLGADDGKRYPGKVEGDWTLSCGWHHMATDGAYEKAGITKPTFEQIPAVYYVGPNGVESQFNVTAEQATEFIKARL